MAIGNSPTPLEVVQGIKTLESAVGDKAPVLMPSAAITGSATLALSHIGHLLICTSASATTITIPANAAVAFPPGTQMAVTQEGNGKVTISPASGVTLRSKDNKMSIDGQYAAATLVKTDTNTWYLWGALA